MLNKNPKLCVPTFRIGPNSKVILQQLFFERFVINSADCFVVPPRNNGSNGGIFRSPLRTDKPLNQVCHCDGAFQRQKQSLEIGAKAR